VKRFGGYGIGGEIKRMMEVAYSIIDKILYSTLNNNILNPWNFGEFWLLHLTSQKASFFYRYVGEN
jgi:hypothetical protein